MSIRRDRSLQGAGKREKSPEAEARKAVYSSANWIKQSKAYLDLYPFCRACNTLLRISQATCVDHIIPHNGDFNLFWNSENWQPLCHPCHGAKTRLEQQGCVIRWRQNGTRIIVHGKPGAGKTTWVRDAFKGFPKLMLDDGSLVDAAEVFDMDVVAQNLGLDINNEADRVILKNRRQRFVEMGMIPDVPIFMVLIVASPFKAFEFGRMWNATMIHVWVEEQERLRRLALRSEKNRAQ